MNRGLWLAILWSLSTTTLLATDISGPVSGVWDPSGNPYNLVDSTWVPYGETLTILPGVNIDWNWDGTKLMAYGRLEALGIPGNRIDMTNAYGFLILYLHGSGPESDILECVSIDGKIYASDADHELDNIDLYFSSNSTEFHAGIQGPANNISISNCTFELSVSNSAPAAQAYAIGLHQTNGFVQSCHFDLTATNSNSTLSAANAVGVDDCDGTFTANIFDLYASASGMWGPGYEAGFDNCSGVIKNNYVKCGNSSASKRGVDDGNGDVINNTFYFPNSTWGYVRGIELNSGQAINNVLFCEDGVDTDGIVGGSSITYNTLWGFMDDFLPVTPAVTDGNRIENPLFDPTTGFLLPASHCTNQGDPDSAYNDPDGTRNDRGWIPFDPGTGANLLAIQNSLDFGLVQVGSYSDITVTFVNIGSAAGEIQTALGFVPAFGAVAGVPSGPIPPGDSVQVTIRFSPQSIGEIYYDELALNGMDIPVYHLECYGEAENTFLEVVLTPASLPITIPASGGAFDYNIAVSNLGGTPLTVDGWCMVMLPDSAQFGPVLGPVELSLPPGYSLNRDRTQEVPASAPPGSYTYTAYVGDYPAGLWDSDSFSFEKLNTGDSVPVHDWHNNGAGFEAWICETMVDIPADFTLTECYPNPFNPTTTIRYSLPEASLVHLDVYDIAGRSVATLIHGWRKAGYHETTFDGSHLSSGIYIYRLEVGSFTASGKMVLLK